MVNSYASLTDILYIETGIGFSAGDAVTKSTFGTVILAKTTDIFNSIFGIELKTNFVKNFLDKDVTTFENFENTLKNMVSGNATMCNTEFDFNTEYERLRLELFKVVEEDDESMLTWQYHVNNVNEVKMFINKCIDRVKEAINKNLINFKGILPLNKEILNQKVYKEVVNTQQPLPENNKETKVEETIKETEQVSNILQEAMQVKEIQEAPITETEAASKQQEAHVQQQEQAQITQTQPVVPIYPHPINTDMDITNHAYQLGQFIMANFNYAIPYENGFLYPCNSTSKNVIKLFDTNIPGGRLIDIYPIYTCSVEMFNLIINGTTQQTKIQQPLIFNKPESVSNEQHNAQQSLINATGPVKNNVTGEVKVNITPNMTEQKEMTVNQIIQNHLPAQEEDAAIQYNNALRSKFINVHEVVENETDYAVVGKLYNGISQSHELKDFTYRIFTVLDGNNTKAEFYALSCGPNGEIDCNVAVGVNVAQGQFVKLNKEQAGRLIECFKAYGLIK